MAAIITDQFRRNSVSTVLADLASNTNSYYIGIGKTDAWPVVGSLSEEDPAYTVPASTGTRNAQKEVKTNLMSLLRVQSSSARVIIPNVPLTVGKSYKQYSSNDASAFTPTGATLPCYAIYDNKIWLCLKTSGAVVTNLPSTTALYTEDTATGSTWIAIAATENNSPFNTDQFIAVVVNEAAYTSVPGLTANNITKGRVYSFTIASGGNYTGTTTAVLVGDGNTSSIPLTVTKTGNVITGIDFTGGTNNTLNFTNASVVITGTNTTPAVIIPNIAPLEGFGPTILNNLPTWFLGLSADFDGDLAGDAPLLKYRQISVIKNPAFNLPDDGNQTTADALKYLTITNGPLANANTGDVIEVTSGSASGTKAWFDSAVLVTGTAYKIYYHQNDSSSVNYGSFGTSGTININGAAYTYSTAPDDSEYDHNSGEVLFIENRKPVSRNVNQKEEIKLVIQY
jgi:hypothetical protein